MTGNTVVVLAATDQPLPAITLAEVLATSDLPGGVVNMLTGKVAETAPWLAAHMDVNALDLTGVDGRRRWPPSWRRPRPTTSNGFAGPRRAGLASPTRVWGG